MCCGLSKSQFSLVAMKQCNYDPAVKSAYAQARKHLIFQLGDKQTSMQTFALTPFKTLPSTMIHQTAIFPGLLQHHERPPARWVHRQAQKHPFSELSGGLILPKHRSTPLTEERSAGMPRRTRALRIAGCVQARQPAPASPPPTANRFPHDTVSGRSARCLCRAVLRCRAR